MQRARAAARPGELILDAVSEEMGRVLATYLERRPVDPETGHDIGTIMRLPQKPGRTANTNRQLSSGRSNGRTASNSSTA